MDENLNTEQQEMALTLKRAPIFAYLAIKSQKCRTEIPLRLIATWRRRLRLIATIPLTIHLRMRRSRWISVKGWSRWICFLSLYARINTCIEFLFIAILNLSSDFADLAQTPDYATMVKDLESSDLLGQVDIGHRSFFDPPQRLLNR